jgi:hypothetical protein
MLGQFCSRDWESRAVSPSAFLLGVASGTVLSFSPQLAAGEQLQAIYELMSQPLVFLESGHARAPALVIVLLALLILPMVALASLIAHKMARAAAHRRARTALLAASTAAQAEPETPGWRARAWLALDGKPVGTLPAGELMLRLGRHRDNDVQLPYATVHRFHALIHRNDETGFVITDLSGNAGNGVRVNGERRVEARLADGDLIELGKVQLTFASSPA